jgi:hypothetical protein
MKKINILGHELNVSFNMAVELEYEDISGQPFDLEAMNTQKATMQLCYASLKVANDKLPFSFASMNENLSFRETAELKNAVIDVMNEWLGIPAVMAEEAQAQSAGEEGKNA